MVLLTTLGRPVQIGSVKLCQGPVHAKMCMFCDTKFSDVRRKIFLVKTLFYCNFYNIVSAVFEEVVGRFNLREWVSVGNQRCGIDFALGDEP